MDSKWILQSKGVLGPVLALVGLYLGANGVPFGLEEQSALLEAYDQAAGSAMTLGGIVLGLYGRLVAEKKLRLTP